VSEIVCGRCIRKEMTLDLETRMSMAKAIIPDDVYECIACNTSFYFHKFRMIYIGDRVPEIHKSVLE
jgi:hypothetical protein